MLKYIKLVDGDEIVGDISDENSDENNILIYNPLQLLMRENDIGKYEILFSKYLLYTPGNNFVLPMKSVMFITNVSSEIYEYYYVALEFVQKNIEPMVRASIMSTTNTMRSLNDGSHESESIGTPMGSSIH